MGSVLKLPPRRRKGNEWPGLAGILIVTPVGFALWLLIWLVLRIASGA